MMKFLKFFVSSIILDEKFLMFFFCNVFFNVYKNSDLFFFFKGFLGVFLIGFVVYYGCALIFKKCLKYLLEWLFIGSGIIFSVVEIFMFFMFKMFFFKGLIDMFLVINSFEMMVFIKSYKNYLFYYVFILIVLLIIIKMICFRAFVFGVIVGVLGFFIFIIGSVCNIKYFIKNDVILKRLLFFFFLVRGFYFVYLSLFDY